MSNVIQLHARADAFGVFQVEEAADRRWCVELQARLAMVPTLEDVDLATRLNPVLRRGGRLMTWRQFADENRRAAAELCRRLAEIARSESPDRTAIADALELAGLSTAVSQ